MDYIVFLGTAGARVVVFKQIRASGGLWFSLDGTEIMVDPGPGSLVKCMSKKEKLDPAKLSGIILTHRHLDHSADVNVMIEAMTNGGFKKKGMVFAPEDAIENDPVILKYLRGYVDGVSVLKEKGTYSIGDISFTTPIKHIHGKVETYGLKFKTSKYTISYITDTKFFQGLKEAYKESDLLIINVVRYAPSEYDHLCLDEAKELIKGIVPKMTVLTHFGMTMIRAKPWEIAPKLTEELGLKILCARDGMRLDLQEIS